jgi:predicted nucleic acid-binding protein
VIFIDTSAFYAIVDRDDAMHERARELWHALLSESDAASLITSNYVLVESFALLQSRLGIQAVRAFHDAMLPIVTTQWITAEDHAAATHALLTANRRSLSLVDCVSFHLMRRLGIGQAFCFDRDFAEQGFSVVPA